MEKNNLNIGDEYSILKPGDKIPYFTWLDENGILLSAEDLMGQYSLIIFFAADCRHCLDNFAFLEKNLFSCSHNNLIILAFGRECNTEQLEFYQNKINLSIKLTADPQKEVYLKFAEKAIPRVYLFDTGGKLMKSIRGFRVNEITEIINIINN